ncbi:protein O-linked-mannose beta-1,2-N-acetylglucosaminyltransferase 1-like [Dysidea avara]|uniref:protein O-linked-mannose beta-1,2-N-acetylglucosaminyltransferase 1-like n=1 Tax=Dysidea avara TaxID=196820 RepID=UPI0033313B1A
MNIARIWKVLLAVLVSGLLLMDVMFVYDLTTNHMGGRDDHTHSEDKPSITKRIANVLKASQPPKKFLHVQMYSSKEKASIKIEGKNALHVTGGDEARGMYVVVVNQATGAVMADRRFDTYMPGGSDQLEIFLESIMAGRYLFFAIKDEATFSLKDSARQLLKKMGSHVSESLHWRDMWVFATQKNGDTFGEDFAKSPNLQEWGQPTTLAVTIPLANEQLICDWPDSKDNIARRNFCSRYEGYGELCDCSHPLPITIKTEPLPNNNVKNIPVGIIASNRPQYLFKGIRSMLSAPGANASLITAFIDGFYQEPVAVASLYNIRAVQHEPSSQKNGRITQHYLASLKKIFELYPDAPYAIVIEEDLEVSPDFFNYFSQTIGLMDKDDTIYCVSAWNDLGYEHSCEDSQLLYRVETMPGLGWLLKRKMFKEELEPIWPTPDKLWDWDMWMRIDEIRKERECIIPDVSRTYHFGNSGTNVNPYFQEAYFKKHKLNKQPMVELKDLERMTHDGYEEIIHELIKKAVRHLEGNPCKNSNFVPDTKGKIYTMYISKNSRHDYDTWMGVAKCFKLWDLDARGFHKSLWRFWFKSNQIVVIGCPDSPYCTYKPDDVELLKIEKPKNR